MIPAVRKAHAWEDDARHIEAVNRFWRDAGTKGKWFGKDQTFDRTFRDRFIDLHMEVAERRQDGWMQSADGALALLILTDQFPRNAFRGTGHMYATDPLARHYARLALTAGHMARIDPDLQLFFCLPFAHSKRSPTKASR